MQVNERIEPLLDVRTFAELVRVSPYTVRSWIRKGVLRATKLGRLVRIEPSDAATWHSIGLRKITPDHNFAIRLDEEGFRFFIGCANE